MTLTIVVPCFNEEAALPKAIARLESLLDELVASRSVDPASHVLFVDDGSRDATWSIIEAQARRSARCRGLKLSRNRGHQHALLAGLVHAEGSVTVSLDADLQDDLQAVEKMLDAHRRGAEIVYGVRLGRESDTRFKRWTAESYYRLLRLFGVEVVFNHADFRLMSRRAIEALRGYSESNLFLRGLVPQLGFTSAIVHYDRQARIDGESKYPLGRMLSLAWQGITSFSSAPLRAITVLGFLVSGVSLALSAWALGLWLFTDRTIPGWTSTVVPFYLLGGIQLLCIGILGEYMAKIYAETKRRPLYTIEKIAGAWAAQPRPHDPGSGIATGV